MEMKMNIMGKQGMQLLQKKKDEPYKVTKKKLKGKMYIPFFGLFPLSCP